jgi:hypothetical protein
LELRKFQHATAMADDKLVRRLTLRKFELFSQKDALDGFAKSNDELVADCREARGNYGPLEDTYNKMEDLLNEKEYEITRLEEHGFVANLTPPHIRANFGSGALNSLGLSNLCIAQGTSGFPL